MHNNDILRRVDVRKILIKTTAERRSSCCAIQLIEGMIEGRSGRGYVGEIKAGRRCVVIKRLSSKGKKLQAHQLLGEKVKEERIWGTKRLQFIEDNNLNSIQNFSVAVELSLIHI